jgi:hypothetical protein
LLNAHVPFFASQNTFGFLDLLIGDYFTGIARLQHQKVILKSKKEHDVEPEIQSLINKRSNEANDPYAAICARSSTLATAIAISSLAFAAISKSEN